METVTEWYVRAVPRASIAERGWTRHLDPHSVAFYTLP